MSNRDAIHTWRSWALSRIRICRIEEERFSFGVFVPASKRKPRDGAVATGDTVMQAVAERRALEASLRMLDVECKHTESKRMRFAERAGMTLRCTVCHAVTEPAPQPPEGEG